MSRRTEVADVPAVLYGVEGAAAALRLSRSVLYELIRSGQLRTVKQGCRRRAGVPKLPRTGSRGLSSSTTRLTNQFRYMLDMIILVLGWWWFRAAAKERRGKGWGSRLGRQADRAAAWP